MRQPQEAPAAFQAAWHAHDMPALGALFEDDATFVNRFGPYVKGVAEIVALHAKCSSRATSCQEADWSLLKKRANMRRVVRRDDSSHAALRERVP